MNQNDESPKLEMTFDPNTIDHLGIKMYSYLPNALAEIVANSYDAGATRVDIKLYDNESGKRIVVKDNGDGMSFDEINSCFLKIGRNRREEGHLLSKNGSRKATGKKGLGKLALFGIGDVIQVETTQKGNSDVVKFEMNWKTLKSTHGGPYQPTFAIVKGREDSQGTLFTLSELKRVSDVSLQDLSISLSKLFNFLSTNFQVFICMNDKDQIEITNELKCQSLEKQFEWDFPESSPSVPGDYEKKAEVTGKVITTKKPLKNDQRGITLYAHGRLVNLPEFFDHKESSNFFSYATGWLNVDFVDDLTTDVISTNRQSLDWETENTIKLRDFLSKVVSTVHADWRKKRAKASEEEAVEATGVDTDKWLSTVPPDKAKIVQDAMATVSDPDTETNVTELLTKVVHEIMPEYAELHWRYLHPAIHKIAERDYKDNFFFEATSKATQLYVQRSRDLAEIDDEDLDKIFNPGNGVLMVTDCTNETERNIQNGQQFLSRGLVAGCRNPLIHNPEFEKHLKDTGLFLEKDCLDMLALTSHLFTRLDKAKKRPATPPPSSPSA